ncbi:MAG: hypothetical protein KGK30_00020 [Elusimicrobia bacterium]|nr:hypothetical protein [Elusimicrobiota bacterium]
MGLAVGARAQALSANTGLQGFEIGISTPAQSAVLISKTAGYITAAEISSATAAGNFCAFYDSNTVSGYTAATQAGTAAAPRIATLTAASTTADNGFPAGSGPIPFNKGLVGICNVGDLDVHIRVD